MITPGTRPADAAPQAGLGGVTACDVSRLTAG